METCYKRFSRPSRACEFREPRRAGMEINGLLIALKGIGRVRATAEMGKEVSDNTAEGVSGFGG